MTATQKFVEDLASMDAHIAQLLAQHKRDNDEILPHVFMGDVVRFAGELARHQRPGSDALLGEVLEALELAMTSGVPEIEELVVVSFLENLHQVGDAYDAIVQRLGPKSRLSLELVERER